MKSKLLLICLFITSVCSAQLRYKGAIFEPVSRNMFSSVDGGTTILAINPNMWAIRPLATVPVLKIEGGRVSTATVGGGLSYQYLKFDAANQKWKSIISLSPATVLLGVDPKSVNFSWTGCIGLLNNLITIGGGRDFTTSQYIYFFGFSFNFNN